MSDYRIECGDCLDLLRSIPSGTVDAVITDPPYGIDETHTDHLSGITLRNGEAARNPLGFAGISGETLVKVAHEFVRISKRWVIFTCEWKHAHLLDECGLLVRLGIWRKRNGAPQFTGDRPGTGWEAVAICHRPGKKRWNGGGNHAFWDVPKPHDTEHPTQKPVQLIRHWLEDFTDAGETVCDPYMGSGTVGVACLQTGRKFIGFEIDPGYCEIARRRLADVAPLFMPPPATKEQELFQ